MMRTINSKLQEMLATLALTFSLIILAFMVMSFFYITSIKARRESQAMIEQNATLMKVTLDTLYTSFLHDFGTEEFQEELWEMANGNVPTEHTRYSIQNELLSFMEHNTVLSSAGLYDPDSGKLYTLYKEPVLSDRQQVLTEEDMDRISVITWLTARKTPFLPGEDVSYLVFPLNAGTYVTIAPDREHTDAYLIAFVNNETLSDILEFRNSETYHSFFLFSGNGECILGCGHDKDNENARKAVAFALTSPGISNMRYDVTSLLLEDKGIYVVDCVNYFEVLHSIFSQFVIVFVSVITIVFLIMSGSRRFIQNNITDPIETLKEGVRRISDGDYTHEVSVNSDDELGLLARSFNSMSSRIVCQMEEIKTKEAEAYQAELRLLTEQLNPHLIYNTLEYIRQGIISSSTENAGMMIKNLSTYLRTALVGGSYLVTVQNEVKHIISYINIMSARFNKPISLTVNSQGCENSLILKSLMQPIIENAIKHGFSIDKANAVMMNPSIDVLVRKDGGILRIEISDNGCGFDTEKVLAIMTDEKPTTHVGLTNTYRRMITFYGRDSVEIRLSSIPYYRNTFTFIVPENAETE